MKKIVLLTFVLLCSLSSCLKNSHYESNEVVLSDFERYRDYFKKDSMLYHKDGYYVDGKYLIFMEDIEKDKFVGGSALCIAKDKSKLKDEKSSVYSAYAKQKEGYYASKVFSYFHYPENKSKYKHSIFVRGYGIQTCIFDKIYINNTNYVVNQVLYGIGGKPAFKDGDYLILKIIGFYQDKQTNEVIVALADYRDGKKECIKGWKEIALNSLSNINALDFIVESNRQDIRKDFCYDAITFKVHISY